MQNSPLIKLDWKVYFIKCWRSGKVKITDAKLHVPIVTLSTKADINLTKKLTNGFKRFFHWNQYQTIPAKVIN